MLKVLPVKDKEKQNEYCAMLGIEYDADQMAYAAFDDEKFVGMSLFRIIDDFCCVDKVMLTSGTDDHLAIYLLAKAPLNFAEMCGIMKAVYRDENTSLAKELEFVENDGVLTLSLENYFTSPCKRHGCSE